MAPISGFIIISLLVTIVYFLGFLNFITDNEQNRCEMTYMFQYPQLVKIETTFDWKYKKYGLYAYSEGILTERARRMHFTGVPVLFIPGNGGSYKQVRSFASVALRKSLDDGPSFHFDYFALDLNDELSGFNGALLNEQTEYANLSIFRILELYSRNDRYKPSSVVLVGHSMGGIIARGLLSMLPKDTAIPLIITLATPHRRPQVALDVYMINYYKSMQKVKSPNTTIVALSGGYNDLLVTPFITHMNNFEDIDVITTSVPLVWLPVDHRCILWCRQLVLAITRSLFELVDSNTKQIIPNKEHHIRVFTHHLVRNSGVKVTPKNDDVEINFKKTDGDWIENLREQYTISLVNGTKKAQWHMIRLIGQPEYEVLTVLTSNLKVEKWAFACAALYLQGQHRICKNGTHLSHLSEIAPSLLYKRRLLNLNLHELKRSDPQLTHVVIKVLPTNERLTMHVDRYDSRKRTLRLDLPKWWSLTSQTIIAKTEEKVLSYELFFPQLQHIVQSYRLYVTPVSCTCNSHHAVANLHIPWSKQNAYKYITAIEKDALNMRLYTSKPANMNDSVSVKLTLDPICVYSIRVSNSMLGTLSQIARTYSSLLVANVAAVIILTLRNQLDSIETSKSCSIFFVAIKEGVKPYYILTMVKLVSRLLSWDKLAHILPLPDWQIIADEGNDFFFLPLMLYMCSVGLVWMLALVLGVSLFVYESTFYRIASRFLAKTVTGVVKISDWLIGGFQKLPCFVAFILITLCLSSCGALALCLGCAFYFLKLTHMSQEYMEDLLLKLLKYAATKIKRKVAHDRTEENSSLNEIETTPQDKLAEESSGVETSDVSDNEIEEDKVKDSESECSSEEVECEEQEKHSEMVQTISLHSGIFFHFSLFLLWCLTAGLNVPSLLTWAHNFKINNALKPDTSFLPGIILSVCAIPLWQMDLPRPNLRWYKELGYFLNLLAGASLIYAPISIYRLVYILTATIVLITLHQTCATSQTESVEAEESSEMHKRGNPKKRFTKMKAKWD